MLKDLYNMAMKKSELYSSIWASCDLLRGGMDASQYKDYVLFMLFIKYISDKYTESNDFAPPVNIPPGASFKDMVKLKGKDDIGDKINTQIIQPLIDNNSRLARSDFPNFNDPNKLGEGNAKIQRLTSLISIFQDPDLDFAKNRADHDDLLGDAYEYLMRHFAQDSGKSKGQFYTPAEVSRVIAKVIGIAPNNTVAATTAYDPTCGSGSLLLKVAAETDKHITLEGQEKDVTTAGLARMNMILHDFPTANILQGNTLTNPKFKDGEQLRTYDFVVANPPFSDKSWSTGLTPNKDIYQRFEWGEPPTKQGDYAYLLHIIRSMKSKGKGACVLPHGVLFRGNAEAIIRKKLVLSGYLKGIIGLPANLFYGTGIPACILVLDKENASARKGIFMIDASKGFIKDGNKNRLRERDIHKIVDTFKKQEKVPRYARMVSLDEISDPKNDYNLNLPRYIDSTKMEDNQDITGHLRGGIPNHDIDTLEDYWKVLPSVRKELFENAGIPGYSKLRLPKINVNHLIQTHDEFKIFKKHVADHFDKWCTDNKNLLRSFDKESNPKELIEVIAENLLSIFKTMPLLDAYEVYQQLMNYWIESMQDDCYLIASDGWMAKTHHILEEVKSGKKKGEMKDKGWDCDLIPKSYLVSRYFVKEQNELDILQSELTTIKSNQEKLKEEHGGEEGILKDVTNKTDAQEAYTQALISLWNEKDKVACDSYNALVDLAETHASKINMIKDHQHISVLKNNKGNLTLKSIKDRLKVSNNNNEKSTLESYLNADKAQKTAAKEAEKLLTQAKEHYTKLLKTDPLIDDFVDINITAHYLELLDGQSLLNSKIKELSDALDKKAYEKYPQLSVDEIKSLVVNDKWLSTIDVTIHDEVDRTSQSLTQRVKELAERYETPLPQITKNVAEMEIKVNKHLEGMGFKL